MQKRKPIIIVSGKHPLHAQSGYAHYAGALAQQLARKRDVHIYCVGKYKTTEHTKIGTIHTIASLVSWLLPNREMFAFIPLSFILARHIPPGSEIWGIGPWTLAGVLAHPTKLYADYFTTIRHEWGTPLFSPVEQYLLSQSDKIITHYKSTETILHHDFAFPKSKYERRPYPVTTPKRDPILLTVCRQDARKGIPYLLEAYRRLNKKNVRFQAIIIGSGRQLWHNKWLARNLTNVTFVGSVHSIGSFLHSAYCFILPSLEEGSGSLAIREAMMVGLPIIATTVDGIPEDVPPSCGILVPPKNISKLVGAIETMLNYPTRARQMGRAAQKKHWL